MTDEEKAREYTKQIEKNQDYPSYACYDCERLHEHNERFGIGENEALKLVEKAYLDGLKEGKKEVYELYNAEVDDIAKDYAERLRKFEKENAELKEKVKGFESGDVCWQGDMDATIKQNLELKDELAEQKEKHESNKRALKLIIEKGVQLEKENEELKEMFEFVCKQRFGYAWNMNKDVYIADIRKALKGEKTQWV